MNNMNKVRQVTTDFSDLIEPTYLLVSNSFYSNINRRTAINLMNQFDKDLDDQRVNTYHKLIFLSIVFESSKSQLIESFCPSLLLLLLLLVPLVNFKINKLLNAYKDTETNNKSWLSQILKFLLFKTLNASFRAVELSVLECVLTNGSMLTSNDIILDGHANELIKLSPLLKSHKRIVQS